LGDKLRLRFSKVGRVKYISHLDLMRTIHRALLRAGVVLKYSEGFNPHPYISAALPLSVGYESICELMDVGISDEMSTDGLPAIITAELPEGLEILEAYTPLRKFNEIAWVEISGVFYYDTSIPPDAVRRLSERFSEGSIVVSKKTKRGLSDVDIAAFIHDVRFFEDQEDEKRLTMNVKLSAQNPTITPENLVSALDDEYIELAPDFTGFMRIEVFDREMNIFR